jgi:hypothetical protein
MVGYAAEKTPSSLIATEGAVSVPSPDGGVVVESVV